VVKKRFRKKPMYTQDDMDLRLLAPFDDGTIVGGEMVEELIIINFIIGLELGIRMPSLTYLHESAKEPTAGQAYVKRYTEMRLCMNWSRHLTPWPEHLFSWNQTLAEQKLISLHYNTYTQYHPLQKLLQQLADGRKLDGLPNFITFEEFGMAMKSGMKEPQRHAVAGTWDTIKYCYDYLSSKKMKKF
jgi:hypothetical protein